MPSSKDTSSTKGGNKTGQTLLGKTLHPPPQLSQTTEGVLNIGENSQKREFIGIKIKATDAPDGRRLSTEKSASRTKGKSISATSNQRNTEKGDNSMNNPRRSSRQRRPAWKTIELEKSETLKCNLKFQKMKSKSDLTHQKNSQSRSHSKCLNSASLSQIPAPKGGDAIQKKFKEPWETKYPCSSFAKPDYSQHVRQSKKTTKLKCSPTYLKRSPGGAKERARRYMNRKRKRRSVELLGKYRKKKLRSNQTNDLWEGFPFNLQMPRNKIKEEALEGGSEVFQGSFQVVNKESLSDNVTQADGATKGPQDEDHGNSEIESSNHVNNLTFTITTGKKKKRRHKKRKKHCRSSPNSEQRTENCSATVSEPHRSGSKTYITTTHTASSTKDGRGHPADLETTSNKPQHECQTVSKFSRKSCVTSQDQEAPSTSSSYNRNDTKGRKGDITDRNRSKRFNHQKKKTKQKSTKKVKSLSVYTSATTVDKKDTVAVSSIKLTVTKVDTTEVHKEGNDDHRYRVVVNGLNLNKQIGATASESDLQKADAEDEQFIYGTEDKAMARGHEETNPKEIKDFQDEGASSQVGIATDGYHQLLLDPSNRRPPQNSLTKKAEFSGGPITTIVESESPENNTKLEDEDTLLNGKSDILSETNYKLDTSTDGDKPIVMATQADEPIDKHELYEDSSVSKDDSDATLTSDESLFCPVDEQADDESDCEEVDIKVEQKKKSKKRKATLKVKLPSIRFAMKGNRGEKALKEVSPDKESAVLSPSSSGSSNTQEVQPLPSPSLQQVTKTTPKKTKCQKLSNDSKSKSTNAPLMQKSRKECTDWRLLSPSNKHRNIRRVSSEGKIPNNSVPSPHHPSTSQRHKRTISNDQRKCASSTAETKQGGLPAYSRPLTRRQSLESNTESGNRRHYQFKNPDASGEELDKLMRDAWEKLNQKEKLQYYKRAFNATTDRKKSTSTTATRKKEVPPPPKPQKPEPQQSTSKPAKPLQDPFYTLSTSQQEAILLDKLKYFQQNLSAHDYNRLLYEFITSFKRSVRNFKNRKAEWLDDPIERGVQFASVSRRMLYNKMKQYEGIVTEVSRHKQYLAYKHHKLKYDDILWKIITGRSVQFDDTAHSDRLTLLLEAIEDVEQNMDSNSIQVSHQDHGRGEPNQVSACLCGSERERRAVQEIAEDIKHSCSSSGSTRVRINNTDLIIPRVAMDSRLNQQLLSGVDHNVPLQELGAEDVNEYLDGLDAIVPGIGDDVLQHQECQVSLDGVTRVSTPLDGIPGISTPLDGIPGIFTSQDGIPRASTPVDGMSESVRSPLEEAWGATYRCLYGIEQCCSLESPSCILSSLLVDHMMAARP